MTAVASPPQVSLVKAFGDITIDDVASVGGKNASLGEMYRELTPHGVKVPDGFAVTANAYRQFLRENRLDHEIAGILDGVDARDVNNLARGGRLVREAMLSAALPESVRDAITESYRQLAGGAGHPADVAVRSKPAIRSIPV